MVRSGETIKRDRPSPLLWVARSMPADAIDADCGLAQNEDTSGICNDAPKLAQTQYIYPKLNLQSAAVSDNYLWVQIRECV